MKTLFLILIIFSLILLFAGPSLIIKKVTLSIEEESCFKELTTVGLKRGQDTGIIVVTAKEGNKLFLKLYTLIEFNKNWVIECPNYIYHAE